MSKKNWEATQAESSHNRNSLTLLAAIQAKIEANDNVARNGERNWHHAAQAQKVQELLQGVMNHL